MNKNKSVSFEGKIVKMVAFACLTPSILLFYLLFSYPISVYLKILIVILVLTMISYVCFSVWLKIHHQYRTSTNLLEAIIVGDNTMRANTQINAGALAEFNLVLNGISKVLSDQKLAVKEQQLLFSKVIAQIDVAIIATDVDDKIVLINPSAEKLFSCRLEQVQGGAISQIGLQNIGKQSIGKVVEFELKQYRKKVYLHTDEYLSDGQRHRLIFITDIQRLLRDEERLAWQRLVRVLSHEINNSLTPIASISESLKRICADDFASVETQTDLKDGLTVISERAFSLNSFINSYHQLSTLPTPTKTVAQLSGFITSITALYPNVSWQIKGDVELKIFIDPQQIQQALVNLITNSLEANNSIDAVSKSDADKDKHKVCLSIHWAITAGKLVIELLDNGCGIANIDNLFVPFYSTKKQGSGIGLVLSRQIIMNHDGDLQLQNRDNQKGVKASIYLPYQSRSNASPY